MWITWKNTAPDAAGTITTANNLEVDFDLRMYDVGLDTGYNPDDTNRAMDSSAGPNTYDMKYYLLFANPYLTKVDRGSPGGISSAYADLPYDAVIGWTEITATPGTPDTATIKWKTAAGKLADAHCTSEDIANCTNDTNNNWSTTIADGDDQCTEKWTIIDPHIRCVRVQSNASRKFQTPDVEDAKDIDLGYRTFMVTAGWDITSTTVVPTYTQKFTR